MCNWVVEHDYSDITHGQAYPSPYTEFHVDDDDDDDPDNANGDGYAGDDDDDDDYDGDDDERRRLACWLYRRWYTLPACDPSVANLVGAFNLQPNQSNAQ